MQRLIFEASDNAGRLSIYDFASQELLAEVTDTSWHRLFEALRIGDSTPKRTCCAHHATAESPTDRTIRDIRRGETAITQSLCAEADPGPSMPIPRARPPVPAIAAAPSAAALTDLSSLPNLRSGQKTTGRRKLWNVPHKYHCPIIGTCLTVNELRRIADRTARRPAEPLSDFDIHVSFVAAATAKNPVSLATHKTLDKKFAATVRRYAKARDADALTAFWRESLATGEVPGGLWAVMTHPRADDRVLTRVYEEVHMLSHQIGAGQRADLKQLADTRVQLERLQRDFDSLYTRTRDQANLRESRIRELEIALTLRENNEAESCAREQALREQLTANNLQNLQERIAALAAQVETLNAELTRIRGENETQHRECVRARQEAEAAQRARITAETECRAAEGLLAQLLSDRCNGCDAQDCAQRNDLGGRLVLCVGGRKQLVEQYRTMIAGCNGRFDHHDGGMEDNQHRLETMLASADIVICATDYVSHGAYYRTKRFCKHNEKPHVLLGNSGVSAFALAIEKLTS